MKKILVLFYSFIIAFVLVYFSSCGSVNGFTTPLYYREFFPPESIAPEVALKDGEEPEIIYVTKEAYNNPNYTIGNYKKYLGMENILYHDNIEDIVFAYVQEKHYKIVGKSSFKNNESAIWTSYAKKIKTDFINLCRERNATTVIWSDFGKVVGQSVSSGYSITQYNQASKTYTTTSYSGDIYDVHQYTYTAYFLVPYSESEKSSWRLGIEARDLTADDRKELKQNTGVVVDLVFKDYPAYFANIASGDIIAKINGNTIFTMEDYQKTEQLLKLGEQVKITFVRDGTEKTVIAEIK